jgi:hypothetical protein
MSEPLKPYERPLRTFTVVFSSMEHEQTVVAHEYAVRALTEVTFSRTEVTFYRYVKVEGMAGNYNWRQVNVASFIQSGPVSVTEIQDQQHPGYAVIEMGYEQNFAAPPQAVEEFREACAARVRGLQEKPHLGDVVHQHLIFWDREGREFSQGPGVSEYDISRLAFLAAQKVYGGGHS